MEERRAEVRNIHEGNIARWALLAALLAAAAYLPALSSGFVWDDRIVQRDQIPHLRSPADAFSPPPGLSQWTPAYYRPVVLLTYQADARLNRLIFGEKAEDDPLAPALARFPHAANVVFHALASFLVTLLAFRLLVGAPRAGPAALAAGILFAVHPVHVESVCNIAGRSDVLATLFVTAGLLAALRHAETGKPAPAFPSAGLFFLGFLSKETALAALPLLPACLFMRAAGSPPEGEDGRKRRRTRLAASVGAAAAAYFLLRIAGGSTLGNPDAGLLSGLGSVPSALAYAFRFAFLPFPQRVFVPHAPGAFEAATVLALSAAAFFAAWRLMRKGGSALPLFSLLWIALAAAPSLGAAVWSLSETPVAERYLYLPSAGVSLLAGWVLTLPVFSRPVACRFALIAFAVLAGMAAWTAGERAGVWRDDVSLWTHASEDADGARQGLVWLNLGKAMRDRGEEGKAAGYYRKALDPGVEYDEEGRAYAANNLGSLHADRGNREAAEGRYAEAEADLAKAERYFLEAVGRNPEYASPRFNLGIVRMSAGRMAKFTSGRYDVRLLRQARSDMEGALALWRGDARALEILAQCDRLLRLAEEEERGR